MKNYIKKIFAVFFSIAILITSICLCNAQVYGNTYMLNKGRYTVGIDIPAGTYSVKSGSNGSNLSIMSISNSNHLEKFLQVSMDKVQVLTLEENRVFSCTDYTVFTPVETEPETAEEMISIDFTNLSDLTDSELIALETALQGQKVARGMSKKANVPDGEYIVGQHIPAGNYKIERNTKRGTTQIIIYYPNGKHHSYIISGIGEIGNIMMSEGDTIKINGGQVTFTPFTGIVFE